MQPHATQPPSGPVPSPDRILHALSAWQLPAALKGAVELDLFTAIAQGASTTKELSERCNASERGIRILADYLTVEGFLTKQDGRYGLSEDAAVFLNKNSGAYMGSIAAFLASDHVMRGFTDVAETVRRGTSIIQDSGLNPEHQMWVEFAKSMAPMMMLPTQLTADRIAAAKPGPVKVLDIAAGHGLYGIAVAQRNPGTVVVGVDWKNVLAYAKENAEKMGIGDRFEALPGDAFNVEFGSGYDVVLLPNFLHHFDVATNEALLRKVYLALKSGGIVAVVEFVPNEDRVSPPFPAAFAFMMLGGTPTGDAYTEREIRSMLENADFEGVERHDLVPTPQTLVIGRK